MSQPLRLGPGAELLVYTTVILPPGDDGRDPLVVVGSTKEACDAAVEEYKQLLHEEGDDPSTFSYYGPHGQNVVMGEPPTPAWQTELFTEAEKEEIFGLTLDETRDSVKEIAADECDNLTLSECINLALDPDDHTELMECMKYLKNGHVSIEDLESEHEGHIKAVATMRRFGLIDERLRGCPITNEGYDLMELNNVH